MGEHDSDGGEMSEKQELEIAYGTLHLPQAVRDFLYAEARHASRFMESTHVVHSQYIPLAKSARLGYEAGRSVPDDVRAVLFYGVVLIKSDNLPLGKASSLSELLDGHGLIEVPMGVRLVGVSHTGFTFQQRKACIDIPTFPVPTADLIVEFQRVLVGLELATQVPRWILYSYAG